MFGCNNIKCFIIKEDNPSEHNFIVAIVDCGYVFRLLQSNQHHIRLYTRRIKRRFFLYLGSERGLGLTLRYIALMDFILLLCILGTQRGWHTLKLLMFHFNSVRSKLLHSHRVIKLVLSHLINDELEGFVIGIS
jgi:hypothetical protein